MTYNMKLYITQVIEFSAIYSILLTLCGPAI
jgi:hypothetical protein